MLISPDELQDATNNINLLINAVDDRLMYLRSKTFELFNKPVA